jgi:hypothetical protein
LAEAGLLPSTANFPGTPKVVEVSTTTTPGGTKVLFSFAVPAGKVLEHNQVVVSCRIRGVWKLFSDLNLRGSGRTGAGKPDSNMVWVRSDQEPALAVIKVEFEAAAEVTVAADIECYYQGSEI